MFTQARTLSMRESAVALLVILGVNALGALPAAFVGADTSWFESPWFFPPTILFPAVWTVLFTLMGIALVCVWRAGTNRRHRRTALAAFVLQFVLNLAWTPVFFGLQRPGLGLVVIAALWLAIAGTIAAFDRVSRLAAGLLVPYLVWVSFAFVLNLAIYFGTG